MSLYGCELWLLSNIHIEELCVSWRKSLRRVWRFPYKTHCYLLPLLCQFLSLEEEICRRSLTFIRQYLCSSSRLVTAIANYGINYGRCNSVLGLNALFYSSKFNVNISNVCGGVVNVRRAVDQYAERKVEEHLMQAADFLRELLNVRDNHLVHSNNIDFNREELHALTDYICTN